MSSGRSGRKIFPTKEAECFNYMQTVVGYLLANATRLNISTARQTILTNKLNSYTIAYNRASVEASRTKNDVSDRNTAREALKAELRDVYGGVAESVLTDTDRNTLNLQKRKASTPVAVPTTKPVVIGINIDNRLQHIISFVDAATPSSKAKPRCAMGCQVWCVVGPVAAPPADTKNYRFLALDTATPYVATFDATDGGKIVWYILRWVNTTGQPGPWSNAIEAIIRP